MVTAPFASLKNTSLKPVSRQLSATRMSATRIVPDVPQVESTKWANALKRRKFHPAQ
jgi:hypothetical protein